ADVKAGNIVLDKGSFDWDVANGTGAITTFAHLEKFGVSIFGFPVAGEATLSFDENGAFIPAHLELPSIFGGITGDVTLRLKNPGGLKLEGFKIHVGEAFLGALQVKPLDVEYKGSQPPVFEGSATFLLPPSYSDPGAHVSFGFVDGKFKHAEGSIPFDPPLALAPPWAYLRQIGLALSTDPLKIGGGVELIGGPQILGTSAVTIDALPPQGFSFTFADPAILKISGSMSVVDIPFASGFVEFRTNGLFKFGGGLDFTAPLDLFSITAGVPTGPPLGPGFIDLSDGRFNAPVSGDVCVPAGCGFIDIGSDGVISSSGFAACGEYLISEDPDIGVSAGFGYHWGGDVDVFGGWGGCDVAPYAVSAPARAAAAGPLTVDVAAGLPQENITVTGTGGAPRITVTAPDGEVVASGPGGAPAKGKHMVVYSQPKASATTVLIGQPVAGQYKVEAQPGSPPIARLGTANGLPEPAVTAKVGGKGHTRTLAYTVKPLPGQTVRFVERSAGAGADLGAAKGAKGTLRFSPADGPKGKRDIVAMVDQNGAPRRQLVVAGYVAPGPVRPGRPAFVRAKRSGGGLKVSWGRAAHAARYVVRIRLHDGTSKLFVLPAAKRSVTIRGVATRTFGSITVAGMTATSTKAGPARKAGVKKQPKKHGKARH
ncbi:MAG: domain containing protein, partial [Solirubrobacterales bacterium]|nr:domain containing protein [Solirubrobacterales bacterium]